MSNRRLGFFGDATAVGWNPSLLGTRKTIDLAVTTPLSEQFSLMGQYGVFAKLLGFGVGYVANTHEAASGELYAGLGFNIIDDVLWLGASGRLVNPGNIQKIDMASLRYNSGLLVKPMSGLYVSGGITTMGADTWRSERIAGTTEARHVRISPDSMVVYAGATYSPMNWISVFANYTSPPILSSGQPVTMLESNPFRLDIGASITLLNDILILSGSYNFATSAVRVGAEANVAALGLGLFREMSPHAAVGHVAVVRLSTDQARSVSALLGVRTDDDGCRTPVDTLFQKSDYMLSFTNQVNTSLADTLRRIAPNPTLLYTTIQDRYYSSANAVKSITGEEINVVSKQGYALQTLDVDNAKFPQVSVVVRAIDTSTGRTVSGLEQNDFSLRDKKQTMISVKPSDTTSHVPLDIVFIIDCSGSMQNKINETRANARRFIEALRSRGADYRVGGILYGLYVVSVLQPTNNFDLFQEFIAKATANQPDEYAPNAFEELLRMKFRPDAERVAILITDELTYTGNYARTVEADIVPRLWQKRIKLHKIIKPCDNNGSTSAYATLGQEFNIKEPFEHILNTIGGELTTTYNITYRRNETKTTAVTGIVKNEIGTPLYAKVMLSDTLGNSIGPIETVPETGTFTTPTVEGKRYMVRVEATDSTSYEPVRTSLNLRNVRRGDTVKMPDIVVKRVVKPIILRGEVRDANGRMIPSDIALTELDTLGATLGTDIVLTDEVNARYEKKYAEGKAFAVFIEPSTDDLRDEYVPRADEINFRRAGQGDIIVYNYILYPYPKAVNVIGRVTVTQPSLQSVSSVGISATDIATSAKVAETFSDNDGRFRLTLPKGQTYSITFKTPEYYSDSVFVHLPKRDTSTIQTVIIPPLVWRKIMIIGKVKAEKTNVPVPSALVVTQRDSTEETLAQVNTIADGSYRLIVPKEMPLRLTAQSSEYFFASESAYFGKNDTAATIHNFRLPQELSLRLNFPIAQYNNPTPYILDTNGVQSSIRWQDELNRVVKNLLLYKSFIAKLIIIGHTDDTSDDAYNLKLGQNRAEFVVGELVKRGIPPEILQAVSEGENKLLPRRTNESLETYRARCRRVELVKTKQ
ncbi:MAG: OmpA family protein [Ignavibacteria bacterium]|nr:OmpA family protein [Ignavibacteria bacterium]